MSPQFESVALVRQILKVCDPNCDSALDNLGSDGHLTGTDQVHRLLFSLRNGNVVKREIVILERPGQVLGSLLEVATEQIVTRDRCSVDTVFLEQFLKTKALDPSIVIRVEIVLNDFLDDVCILLNIELAQNLKDEALVLKVLLKAIKDHIHRRPPCFQLCRNVAHCFAHVRSLLKLF